MHRRGFSLLEVLIIVAIFAIIAAISVPVYTQYLVRSDLANASQLVTQGMGRARILAQTGQGTDAWGFAASGVLFRGSSYDHRDTQYDEYYVLPDTITTSGIPVVIFARLTGYPDQIGNIVLSAYGFTKTIPIIKNVVQLTNSPGPGCDTYDTICHRPGTVQQKTMIISVCDETVHVAHGDTIGAACH